MKYDNLLKRVFFDAMPALLRLSNCAPVVQYLSVEFPLRHKMVADVVALLADGRILHLEFQVTNDPDMHWRCYHYFGSISQQWPEADVIQVVIYLGSAPLTMQAAIAKPTCKFHYEILNLQEVPAEVFIDSPVDAERILAVVSKSDDPRATIRRILASWKGMPENQLRENIDRLRTLSQLRKHEIMTIEEVRRMPFEIDVTDTELYQLGQEEGKAKGKEEGKREEASRILVRLLERRFGPLPPTIGEQLREAGHDQLETWINQSFDARSLADIFNT